MIVAACCREIQMDGELMENEDILREIGEQGIEERDMKADRSATRRNLVIAEVEK